MSYGAPAAQNKINYLQRIVSARRLIVTRRPDQKTDCHNNFGYYACKTLIPGGVFRRRIGSRYAVEGTLVYS
jgi:hypothetical protein